MNLLVDAHVFDEVHQGSRTYLKGLYGELIRKMPDTSFYFAAYNSENLRKEFGTHANVHYIQLKQSKILRLLVEFPFIVKKFKIDYAHYQYISPPIKNCRQIVTTHDILFKDFKNLFPLKYRVINNFLFKLSAKRADILLTVSEFSRKRISKHYSIPVEEIGITTNGISSEFLTDTANSKVDIKSRYNLDKFILYVSRIEPRKNHGLLLRVFSDLRLWEQHYKLVFIGKKDFSFQNLDAYLDKAEPACKQATLLLQNIEQQELVSFYKEATLFIYPSLAEGFGIPPIEAVAGGTTTLCSNATAMSDFTFLGDDLFSPNNIAELKSKILSRLKNPHDSNRLTALQQLVSEQYSWGKSADGFISALTRNRKL